jgi:hypothetical protein
MIKHCKLTLAALVLLLSAFASATVVNAQLTPNYTRPRTTTSPTVVFVGDYITYQWASAFAANPTWINKGNPIPNQGGSSYALQNFQANVIALHPAIVHILIGAYDSYAVSAQSALYASGGTVANIDAMVKAAEAAGIKVILGTTPPISTNDSYYEPQTNAIIFAYGAAHNVPVVDYADMLCGCASLNMDLNATFATSPFMMSTTGPPLPYPFPYGLLPNTAGYQAMTLLAETAIATENITLQSGWLSDETLVDAEDQPPTSNVNTVSLPGVVQFTPVGYYSDGSEHNMINTNAQDATGTWASSDPTVMNVNQKGLAWALSPGTTSITYTAPNGVAFSRWVMYVNEP